jgi:hypothetical protein
VSADRCSHRFPARPDGHGIGCPQCRGPGDAHTERDKALARTVQRPAGKWDMATVIQAIRHLAESGEPFSAEDVTPLLPEVGRQTIGAAFNVARRRGLITAVGFKTSATPSRHGSVIRVWRKSATAQED